MSDSLLVCSCGICHSCSRNCSTKKTLSRICGHPQNLSRKFKVLDKTEFSKWSILLRSVVEFSLTKLSNCLRSVNQTCSDILKAFHLHLFVQCLVAYRFEALVHYCEIIFNNRLQNNIRQYLPSKESFQEMK